VRFGAFDEALLDDANRVIASPGVSLREPFMMSAAIRGVPIIGDIELFAREAQAPIAACHRTNGKSTVTTLVARMAEAAGKRVLAGGNLGRPALDCSTTRRRISTCWSCRASSWIRRAR
jgi:UDP-N-acetylmuramoylalanine--D-glutamate ligase